MFRGTYTITLALLLAAFTTTACGNRFRDPSLGRAQHSAVVSPSGGRMYVVSCNKTFACFRRAGGLCPTGYRIHGTSQTVEHDHAAQALENVSASLGQREANQYFQVNRDVLIECRSSRTTASKSPGQVQAKPKSGDGWNVTYQPSPK